MGETKTIYVLMVTTMRTKMPSLMPATFEGVIEASCEFEYFPAAASFDAEPLEHKGRTMKERFPTVESWEVVKVPFMERG